MYYVLQLKILVLQRNVVHSHSCFSVYFSGNPWDCDCHLEWMLEVNMQATTRNMIRYDQTQNYGLKLFLTTTTDNVLLKVHAFVPYKISSHNISKLNVSYINSFTHTEHKNAFQ